MLLADPYARKKSRTPSKNRVWNFFETSVHFTGDLSSKTQCSQWEKSESTTTTASEHSYFALYEAYGTRPYEWGSDPDRFKNNTKQEEKDLNLVIARFRPRDLETGTFLCRDPAGYADGPNLYCYVHCNPITHFDPLGLVTKVATGGKGLRVYYSEYLEEGDAGFDTLGEGYKVEGGKPLVFRKTYTDTLGFKGDKKDWGWAPARMNTLEGNYFSKDSNGNWTRVPLNKANDLSLSASELATVGEIVGANSDTIENVSSAVVDASMAPMTGAVKLLKGAGTLAKYGNAFINGMWDSAIKQGVEDGKVSLTKTSLDGVGGMVKEGFGSLWNKLFDSGQIDPVNSLNDLAAQQVAGEYGPGKPAVRAG